MSTIKDVLLKESTLKEHFVYQTNNYHEYLANFLILLQEYKYDNEFSIIKKGRILTAALIRKDYDFAKFLLADPIYDLPVIIKTCEILDSRRFINQLNKKTEKIKNKARLSRHKSLISNLISLNEGVETSLSKSRVKFLKENWVQVLSPERLELMVLLYPTKHWKYLIDLMHLKPEDFTVLWFSKYIFTNEYPTDSILDICSKINQDNIKTIAMQYKLGYKYLKTKYEKLLTPDVVEVVFNYTKLEDILRLWEDFYSENILNQTIKRIQSGEEINTTYGELMKNLQNLCQCNKNQPLVDELYKICESKLDKYNIKIEEPVVVLGDASASMDIAIKTSGIIGSVLCKLGNAKLHLFRNNDEPIEPAPRDVKDVIKISQTIKASGYTSPAASLYPFYQNKEIVKTFIVVTDEEENTGYDGKYYNNLNEPHMFASTFKKYYDEVYKAKLVFVSFLRSTKDGIMVNAIKKVIPEIEVTQFILDNYKPDLRKLDSLLNSLSMQTGLYLEQVEQLKSKIENDKDKTFFDKQILKSLLENDNIINITI
jgi:hypothetical protein